MRFHRVMAHRRPNSVRLARPKSWQVHSRRSTLTTLTYGPMLQGANMDLTKQPAGTAVTHPLDPLSEAEVALACDLLRTAKQLGPHTRFSHIQLEESAKADILGWTPGTNLPRQA